MTTQEVANRFSEQAKENRYHHIVEELYSQDCKSIEPAHAAAIGMMSVQGIDAIKEKGVQFQSSVEEMHDGYCSDPVVGGNHFSVAMGMDVTMKGAGRMQMNEVCVYEVKDGKITEEQFFY